MTLVVVGSFNSKGMLKKVEQMFGKFKGKINKIPRLPIEPMNKGIKFNLEENPIQATYFSIGFNIPEITHKDIPSLDILSHILAGTDSSRLEQIVKEQKQLVFAIYSYAFTPKYPGIFIIGGLTAPDKLNAAISAICDEVHKLHTMPISNGELVRAKLNIRSSEIYEKETTGGQAGKYAYFISTAGTHEFEKKYYQELGDITAENVKESAQKYLTPKNSTFVVISPKGAGRLVKPEKIKRHIRRPAPKVVRETREKVSEPVVHKLKNGVRIVIRENHTLPIVSVCAAVHAGLRYESAKTNGINNLIARTMVKGTKNKTAMQVAEKIESIAGSIDGFSGRNSLGLRSEFLSDKFEDGFNLFAEILTEPSFSPNEVKREKSQVLEAIRNQEDALATLAFNKFTEGLFSSHPYGMQVLGTRKTVKSFQPKGLFNYYWNIMNPKDLVVSFSGDISPEEVIVMAEEKLNLPKVSSTFKNPGPQNSLTKPVVIEYTRPEKEQAHIVMGFLGPKISSKDRYAIAVLNNILSGQGGRLFLNLRDRLSLAYSVSSTFFAGIEPGFFAVYIGTEPGKIETALGGIKKEFEELVKKGVASDELSRAKHHIIGSHEMEHQRNSSISSAYAFNLLYGIGLKEVKDYPKRIEKVTRQDILKVAQRYINLEAPVTAIVKPE